MAKMVSAVFALKIVTALNIQAGTIAATKVVTADTLQWRHRGGVRDPTCVDVRAAAATATVVITVSVANALRELQLREEVPENCCVCVLRGRGDSGGVCIWAAVFTTSTCRATA